MSSGIKIGYSPGQRRIKLDMLPKECFASPEPPAQLIERANAKLTTELNQGNIDFFRINEQLFKDVWKAVQRNFTPDTVPRKPISFALGAGARLLKGLVVDLPADTKNLFDLTFEVRAVELNNWRYEWLLLNIEKQLEDLGIVGNPHLAQIEGAFVRGLNDETIKSLAISHRPTLVASKEKPLKLMANKTRREVILAIVSHHVYADKDGLNMLIKQASEAVEKVDSSNVERYKFRRPELMDAIKDAINGPESVGVNLPQMLLVGSARPAAVKTESEVDIEAEPAKKLKAKGKKRKKGKMAPYPGMGFLNMEISEDKMQASVVDFDLGYYDRDLEFEMDETWVRKELKLNDIESDYNSMALVGKVVQAIKGRQDINGMIVASGKYPQPPSGAYLHKNYLDAKINEDEVKDLRDAQSAGVVQPGELVCEFKYKFKGKSGYNLYNEKIPPGEGDLPEMEGRDGCERKGLKFYSLLEGMPTFGKKHISVSEFYHHKGNINLKSGNVYFNGSAIIDGNIEVGATVMVRGDLTVKGTIESALVRVGGSIIVKQGIVTTEVGKVQARGDIATEYIGNSRVVCGGDLKVSRSILNSEVVVGGNIRCNRREGTIAGGFIAAYGDIHTFNFGFPKGDVTVVKVGLDYNIENSINVKKARIAKIKVVNEEDRKMLREMIRKKAGPSNPKERKEAIDKLQERLQRQRDITDRITSQIEALEQAMTWEKESILYVYGTLAKNCEAIIGGVDLAIPGTIANVGLVARKRKGANVVPIENLREEDEAV